jgi:hypothetical protein
MGFKGQYTRNGAVLTGFGAHASSIETQVREWWRSMARLVDQRLERLGLDTQKRPRSRSFEGVEIFGCGGRI